MTSPAPQPITPQPLHQSPAGLKVRKAWFKGKLPYILGAIIVVVAAVALLASWYFHALSPIGTNKNQYIVVNVEQGMNPKQIGALLQKDKVIRSGYAFELYVKFVREEGSLQSGTYRLSPADSTPEVAKHLTNGDVDTFQLTFLPGGTVADAEKVFEEAGYSTSDVTAAFNQQYTGLVFQDKPASTSLEGYIYGDTYSVSAGATVSSVLQTIFDEYSQVVKDNNLIAAYQSHGLTLYQGITLASIIQREMGSSSDPNIASSDQKQVAQVFYLRLADNMPLGSDVTYQYAAKLLGVTPSPSLDSPYNTRLYPGLPPGPIATPGKGALLATADPAPGSYLYFLSGDDGKTYFATTDAQHEANISAHCQVKCSQEQ